MEETLVSYKMKRENQISKPYEFVELSEKNEVKREEKKVNIYYIGCFFLVGGGVVLCIDVYIYDV